MPNLRHCCESTEQSDEPPLGDKPSTLSASAAATVRQNITKFSTCSSDFNNWHWQIKNRIRTADQLRSCFPPLCSNRTLDDIIKKYPLAITPYYASLIRKPDCSDPVFQMSVPQAEELFSPSCLSDDPLEENEDMPVAGLVHRYADRVLLISTTTCASYCRHCTRKRIAGTKECSISPRRMAQVVEYLIAHREVSDVIVSGGDPLTMPTESIEVILSSLRSVPSVQTIRIGSRVPVVLPMRITDELTSMLRKYHPLWINTHFNHPNELTSQAAEACGKLADAGIPLGNQTVLLRGVNDDAGIITELCRGLISMRIRPYYLYQCDLVRGIEHFRTPLAKGIEIIEYMRGRVSGIAIPTFVVDAPHGGGKIPLMPNYLISMSPSHTVLRNYEGLMVNYPEPEIRTSPLSARSSNSQTPQAKNGVWQLATGWKSVIEPANMLRTERRRKIVEKRKKAPSSNNLFEQ